MFNSVKTSKVLTLLFFLFAGVMTAAQNELKLWAAHSYNARITEEFRIKVGQLYLFDGNFGVSSLQNSAHLRYHFNKNFRTGIGYISSSSPKNPDKENRNRVDSRVSYRFKLSKLRIWNTLRSELHFPTRSKFKYRFRYSVILSAGSFKLPLDITPFISNEIHYYLNGRPFQYRDLFGDKTVKQSPDGLHAHRLKLGINLKPFKHARASLSFIRQTEFNLGKANRRLNITDPRNGKIKRRFSNFSVLLLNFSYRFKISS